MQAERHYGKYSVNLLDFTLNIGYILCMMKNKVLNYIKQNKMIEAGESVVAGVSGGADSMCLLHILADIRKELNLNLAVVHIHHGIRKETADRDADFVERYCEEKDIPFYVYRYDVPKLAAKWGMSDEEAGRKIRYEAFEKTLEQLNQSGEGGTSGGKIAVAHNADDLAETVLLNLFRGTGLKGLAGIQPVRGNIIRPILCLTREEVEKYDRGNNIDFVTDETNLENEYTRNRIRLDIIPKIVSGINDKAVEHINNTAYGFALLDDYIDKESDRIMAGVAEKRQNGLYIAADGFMALHEAMKWQVAKKCLYSVAKKTKDISRVHMDSLMGLFDMQVGKKVNLPYGMTAVREYGGVLVKKDDTSINGNIILEKNNNIVNMDGPGMYVYRNDRYTARLTIEKDIFSEKVFEENNFTKWIDCDIMKDNLQLRTRMQGDYIVTDSSGSKKKLKDFFIDKKIPREERENVLLVTSGNEVVWIVGYRLNGARKVSKSTENILKLTIKLEES